MGACGQPPRATADQRCLAGQLGCGQPQQDRRHPTRQLRRRQLSLLRRAPREFEARIDELAPPLGRPILCTEYLARPQGSTIEGILPIAKRRNVAAYNWGLVAGKTQTYLPWDTWDKPDPSEPKVWFSDLLRPDGSAYRDGEVKTIQQLTGAQQAP